MSEKSTRTYLDVFKHILSDGESVFPFSRASNEYDLSNLSNVKFRAGACCSLWHAVGHVRIRVQQQLRRLRYFRNKLRD